MTNNIELIREIETDNPFSIYEPFIQLAKMWLAKYNHFYSEEYNTIWDYYLDIKEKNPQFRLYSPYRYIKFLVLKYLNSINANEVNLTEYNSPSYEIDYVDQIYKKEQYNKWKKIASANK